MTAMQTQFTLYTPVIFNLHDMAPHVKRISTRSWLGVATMHAALTCYTKIRLHIAAL